MNFDTYEIWLATGSQHLYGPDTLRQVAQHAQAIGSAWNASGRLPVRLKVKSVLTTPEEITSLCREANQDQACVGLITWMHTFSPAKMWIRGMQLLDKPLCHLHTQFNAEIPWGEIDMDFMNLNQSAHGDREFAHLLTRLGKARKTVVGHWQDPEVLERIAVWSRVALGCRAIQELKVARFGDNMRQVSVTEGDKVAAEMTFGVSVHGYEPDVIARAMPGADAPEVATLLAEYENMYRLQPGLMAGGDRRDSLVEAARIELGLRNFLSSGGFHAFTDTFENLGSLKQLPGLAVQRLMADGYGFGAEGDWMAAAMLRACKVMGNGMAQGTSFMEDYTYHFENNRGYVLGSHMLEICPSIAADQPTCEVHPLGIGNREDPVRLVFTAAAGPGLNASLVDLGDRFRLLVNTVNTLTPPSALPKLPTARAYWEPHPDLKTSAACWMAGGGSHHTVFTQALSPEFLEDFAEFFDIELLLIDADTRLRDFKSRLGVQTRG